MSIKIALDKKRDELVAAEDGLAIQEAVLEKLKEKLAEKIEERKGEIKEKIAGKGKEKIVEAIGSEALEKGVSSAENAAETYSSLREKYEQGKKNLEILKAKRSSKATEVSRLEDSYHVCMQGGDSALPKLEAPPVIEIPLPEPEYFKATIVEDTLQNKKILDEFEIERTRDVGGFKLHQVNFSKDKIKELQKALAPGPAYVHVWKEDSDEMLIVFKEKIFTIDNTDRDTWSHAIAYGMAVGVPEEQLDFSLIKQKPKSAKKNNNH